MSEPAGAPVTWSVDELLNELAARFPCGILVIQRESLGQAGTETVRRHWGNHLWCVGAADTALEHARAISELDGALAGRNDNADEEPA